MMDGCAAGLHIRLIYGRLVFALCKMITEVFSQEKKNHGIYDRLLVLVKYMFGYKRRALCVLCRQFMRRKVYIVHQPPSACNNRRRGRRQMRVYITTSTSLSLAVWCVRIKGRLVYYLVRRADAIQSKARLCIYSSLRMGAQQSVQTARNLFYYIQNWGCAPLF